MALKRPEARRIHPVILSGGAGTRLWPLSRGPSHPKQFIPLLGQGSLLRQTLERVADRSRFAEPLILSGKEHRFQVGEALREAGQEAVATVLEPVPRNTGPASCIAALILAAGDPSSLMVLLPSDHHIADPAGFRRALDQAADAALDEWIVAFGVAPDRPDPEYGYIRRGEALDGRTECYKAECYKIERFVEKPDRASAAAYLTAGDYFWNSGMLLVTAGRLLEEFERLQPAMVEACRAALAGAQKDLDFLRLEPEAFAAAPAVSLDHAVMERTSAAVVIPVDIGWSDVGSWEALWRAGHPDSAGNVVAGQVTALDSRDNYLHSDSRLLATVAVEGLIVVVTRDAVLVCPRREAQRIGDLVAQLRASGHHAADARGKVYRPWGSYERIDAGQSFQVRRLVINPTAGISLQRHGRRAEHWVVVGGTAEVILGDETFVFEAGRSISVPPGVIHRLANPGDEPLHVVEVRTGPRLDEDDVERFGDA